MNLAANAVKVKNFPCFCDIRHRANAMEITPFEMRMMERLAKKLDIWEYTKNFTPEDSRYFFDVVYDKMDENDLGFFHLDFFIAWQFAPWRFSFTSEQMERYVEFAVRYCLDIYDYMRDIECDFLESINKKYINSFVEYLRLTQGRLWTLTFKNKKTQRLVFETEEEVPSKYFRGSSVTIKALAESKSKIAMVSKK